MIKKSPVDRLKANKLFLFCAAFKKFKVLMDVETAFMHGDLQE